MKILGSRLLGKRVITEYGQELGDIVDAEVSESGKIGYLIVRPLKGVSIPDLEVNGLLFIDYDYVKGIGDYVILKL